MSFGKRKSFGEVLLETQLPVGADGRRRILPESVWSGSSGEFMKRLGLSKDDPSNIVPNPEDIVARYRAAEEAERDVIARFNEKNGPILRGDDKFLPLYMVPLEIWDTRVNVALVEHFELLPFAEWNRMWLPTGPGTAFIMDVFPHPGKESQWMIDSAIEVINLRVDRVSESVRETMNLAHPSMDQINDVIAIKDKSVAEIKAYAQTMKLQLLEHMTKLFKDHLAGK